MFPHPLLDAFSIQPLICLTFDMVRLVETVKIRKKVSNAGGKQSAGCWSAGKFKFRFFLLIIEGISALPDHHARCARLLQVIPAQVILSTLYGFNSLARR